MKKVSLFFRKKGELKYIEAPMFKIDLEYCNYSTNLKNSSNYLLEQSIPLKTKNYWIRNQ